MISANKFSSFKNDLAVITPNHNKYTYSQLLDYRETFIEKINNRSLLLFLSDNSVGSFIGYTSFITSGIVPLIVDSNLDKDLVQNLIKTYKPRYLYAPNKNNFINSLGHTIHSVLGYSLVVVEEHQNPTLANDLCLLLPTSGSTGSPKLVRLSYNNIYSNSKSIINYLSIDKSERPITILPISYSFGLSIINSHLLKGATILLSNDTLFDKNLWSFIKKYRATSISGTPYSFEILKKLRFFNMELPFLKTLTQAGGKLSKELSLEFSKFCMETKKRFFVMYGQTEASPRMSYLPSDKAILKNGSIGIPIPGGRFELFDEFDRKIQDNYIEGELVYYGENVSLGYASSIRDLSKNDDNKGVLKTGDMAKRDHDSFYYIVGRKKRFIKLFGNRINLDETELILKKIVIDCVCAGTDDNMIIYITDVEKKDVVKNYLSKKLKINSRGFDVKLITEIPKNSSGKILYHKLNNK